MPHIPVPSRADPRCQTHFTREATASRATAAIIRHTLAGENVCVQMSLDLSQSKSADQPVTTPCSNRSAIRMHGSLSNCPWSSRSRSADPPLLVHSLDVHGPVRLHGQAAYDWVVAARSCLERGRMAAPERVKWAPEARLASSPQA